mmetsp:Transcript_37499/g.121188  ORF Transcript_37499/g.121188 Transcript_37499/m.121188 type:complete len:216 (+) Transcript_37499:42-689(+)
MYRCSAPRWTMHECTMEKLKIKHVVRTSHASHALPTRKVGGARRSRLSTSEAPPPESPPPYSWPAACMNCTGPLCPLARRPTPAAALSAARPRLQAHRCARPARVHKAGSVVWLKRPSSLWQWRSSTYTTPRDFTLRLNKLLLAVVSSWRFTSPSLTRKSLAHSLIKSPCETIRMARARGVLNRSPLRMRQLSLCGLASVLAQSALKPPCAKSCG